MNFSNKGLFVYLLQAPYGSLCFLVLALFCVLVLIYWYYKSGFFQMLSAEEKNKHTKAYETQYFNRNRNQQSKDVQRLSASSNNNRTDEDIVYKKRDDGSFHSGMGYRHGPMANTIQNK